MTAAAPLLHVQHLTMRFGGILALSDVSLHVGRQEILAVIGPNGAGKTTFFNCITGFYRPASGSVWVEHEGGRFRLDRMATHRIVTRAQVVRTFQNLRLFNQLTVFENVLTACHGALMPASVGWLGLAGLLGTPGWRRSERAAVARTEALLARFGLADVAEIEAGALPYGRLKRLEIARALATGPRLLCLDEPAAGLNPRERQDLAVELRALVASEGISILLIEHDMDLVMNLSDRVAVLDYGMLIAQGTPDAVRADPRVIAAYLGEGEGLDRLPPPAEAGEIPHPHRGAADP